MTAYSSALRAEGGSWKSPSSSPEGAWDFRKKAEEKASSRWTLADWLAQKERNHMMDLWLGMYSPSPYELILGGNYHSYNLTTDVPATQTAYYTGTGTLAFYALMLGIEGFYQNNYLEGFNDSGGMVAFRLLGRAVQNTHLIVQYGVKNRVASLYNLQQQFVAGDLDIYVERHSGLHANYRYYLPTTNSYLGAVSEYRWEATYFFNINFVQVFGGWCTDQIVVSTPTQQTQSRTGLFSGFKLFF